jgi:hypothetical protein
VAYASYAGAAKMVGGMEARAKVPSTDRRRLDHPDIRAAFPQAGILVPGPASGSLNVREPQGGRLRAADRVAAKAVPNPEKRSGRWLGSRGEGRCRLTHRARKDSGRGAQQVPAPEHLRNQQQVGDRSDARRHPRYISGAFPGRP